MDWREEFYSARWHLDVAKRMMESFGEYGSKRFLVGVIREGARSAGKVVRAFLIRERVKGDLRTFEKVAGGKLGEDKVKDIIGILNLERDQRVARVEILRKDEILMEIDGGWRVLRIGRLRDMVRSIEEIIGDFG